MVRVRVRARVKVRVRTGLLDARRGDLDVGQHHADGVVVDHSPDRLRVRVRVRVRVMALGLWR